MEKELLNEKQKDFFALQVDRDLFDDALSGTELQISLPLDDDDYTEIVENFEGSLLMNCDLPDHYHGVYYWNHGKFPYIIKKDLKRIVFVNEGKTLPMTIKKIDESVGQRFRFDHENKRTVSDPEGDSCIWQLSFTLQREAEEVPADKPRTFLLRWNPGISSFTLQDYISYTDRYPEGFDFNWSIYQWKDLRAGDRFYMMRVGDPHAGIMFRGWFTSDPYAGDDWAGKGKPRHYADMYCLDFSAPDAPRIPLARLTEAMPETEWGRGSSGVLLTEEQAAKLESLWNV